MLIALLRLFVVMQRYTIAQAKSREKGKNIFRKNKMAHVAWWRYCGLAAENVIVPRPRYTCIPTEVHMYPDRGTITLKLVSHDIKACFA